MDMDTDEPVAERHFEETLSKDQLKDLIQNKIKPAHWRDGTLSYFRVYKIIEMLREEGQPYDPFLDIAVEVMSDGKGKIHNQTHRDFCKFIQSQVRDMQHKSDEELQLPVECLTPGCFPIGPECESLGIMGSNLLDKGYVFAEVVDRSKITNRIMYELHQFLCRIKYDYDDLAGWLKKILGLSDIHYLTGGMVKGWCNSLLKESTKRKAKSMQHAQKYLMEEFPFAGLDFNPVNEDDEDDMVSSSAISSSSGKNEELVLKAGKGQSPTHGQDQEESEVIDVESLDKEENDKDKEQMNGDAQEELEKIDVESLDKEGNDKKDKEQMNGDAQEESEKINVEPLSKSNDPSTVSDLMDVEFSGDDSSGDKGQYVDITELADEDIDIDSAGKKLQADDISPAPGKDHENDAVEEEGKDDSDKEEKEEVNKRDSCRKSNDVVHVAEKAQSTRSRPSRSAASAAMSKMAKPCQENQAKSPKQLKKETRTSKLQSTSSMQRPQRKILKAVHSAKSEERRKVSKDSEDEWENENEEEEDDEDEEGEEESEEEVEDEDKVTSTSQRKSTKKATRSEAVAKGNLERKVLAAAKILNSLNKVLRKLKKEMRIAVDYLQDETEKVSKELTQVKKQIDQVMTVVKGRKKDDAVEEEGDEENEEQENEQRPTRKTRSGKMKKITVTVEPGVKDTLKRSSVKLTPLVCQDSGDSQGQQSEEEDSGSHEPQRSTQPRSANPKSRARLSPSKSCAKNKRSRLAASKTLSVSPIRSTIPRVKRVPSRSSTSRNLPEGKATEFADFDEKKLLSSRVTVSLVKISLNQDLIDKAEERDVILIDSEDEAVVPRNRKRSSAASRKFAEVSDVIVPSSDPESEADNRAERTKRLAVRNASKRESKIDLPGAQDADEVDEEVMEVETSSRGKSSRTRNKEQCSTASEKRTQKYITDSSDDEDTKPTSSSGKTTVVRRSQGGRERKEESKKQGSNNQRTSSRSRLSSLSTSVSTKYKSEEVISTDDPDSETSEKSPQNKSSRSSQYDAKKGNRDVRKSDDESDDSEEEELVSRPRASRSTRSGAKKPQSTKKSSGDADESSDKEEKKTRRSLRARPRGGRDSASSETKKATNDSITSNPDSDDNRHDKTSEKGKPRSASAAVGSILSSANEWRGTASKEKTKKRSLNDFVKMLNNPKKRKLETVKKTSPRSSPRSSSRGSQRIKQVTEKEYSEDEDSQLVEEEFDDDDFLEKKTKKELEENKQENSAEAEEQKRKLQNGDNPEGDGGNYDDDEFQMENECGASDQQEQDVESAETETQSYATKGSLEDTKGNSSTDLPTFEASVEEDCDMEGVEGCEDSVGISTSLANGEESRNSTKILDKENEEEKGNDFPGDAIVGKRISHRCCLKKHGFYKWYEGTVMHKSTPGELLKLDIDQYKYLNNLYTTYTVEYDEHDELVPQVLQVDWEKRNLNILD